MSDTVGRIWQSSPSSQSPSAIVSTNQDDASKAAANQERTDNSNSSSSVQAERREDSTSLSSASPQQSWEQDSASLPGKDLPKVSHGILRTAAEMHQRGFMHPHVYQILYQGEIKLPPSVDMPEEDGCPPIEEVYRPLRQRVYGLLFNLHHLAYMRANHSSQENSDCRAPEIKDSTSPGPSLLIKTSDEKTEDAVTMIINPSATNTLGQPTTINTLNHHKCSQSGSCSPKTELSPKILSPTLDTIPEDVVFDSQAENKNDIKSHSSETLTVGGARQGGIKASNLATSLKKVVSVQVKDESRKETNKLDTQTVDKTVHPEEQLNRDDVSTKLKTEQVSACKIDLVTDNVSEPAKHPFDSVTPTAVNHPTENVSKSTCESKTKDTGLVPEVFIKEWVLTPDNAYETPVPTLAVKLDWPAPTVHKLWFGDKPDDQARRFRCFLSCLASDSPLMLRANFVPQRLLILATVLRYLVSHPSGCLLSQQELDSFLVTAFSAKLGHVAFSQDLQVFTLFFLIRQTGKNFND